MTAYADVDKKCRSDYYEPRLKPMHYGLCQAKNLRSPASLGKQKDFPFKGQKKRIYEALKRQDFDGVDFSGDGKSDIHVKKNAKGYKKITYSFKGDGKVNQISVFDPKGRLIKEKVDQNMDGQVDYLYECKDQICETRSNYQAGLAHTLNQRIQGPENITYRLLEREDGKMVLKSETTVPRTHIAFSDSSSNRSEGGFCFECYEENYSVFQEILKNFEEARKPSHLKKIDDFYESRVGVLIHEECFDGRYDFDVEEAVSEAIVQGFSCMADFQKENEEWKSEGEDLTGEEAVYKSHIPRLVNLFSRPPNNDLGKSWSNEEVCTLDIVPEKAKKYVDIKEKCDFIDEVPDQPKMFCRETEIGKATRRIQLEEGKRDQHTMKRGMATGSREQEDLVFFNKDGKTKVYRTPSIVVDPQPKDSIQNSKPRFKATIWHELMHNLGYSHEDKDRPDYAWFCEYACFKDSYPPIPKGYPYRALGRYCHYADKEEPYHLDPKQSSEAAEAKTINRLKWLMFRND